MVRRKSLLSTHFELLFRGHGDGANGSLANLCLLSFVRGRPWEVVVEPIPHEKVLLVVTAYPVG